MRHAFRTGLLPAAVGILLFTNLVGAQETTVRIVQTNAAGDNVHIIDPVTNTVVDILTGIEIPHGVTSHPDGSEYYFSNEVEHTLDVFSTETLQLLARIPLTDRPNNVAITPDGAKVYVAIAGGAFLEVIDVSTRKNVRSVPTDGGVHNVYVTPDGSRSEIGCRTVLRGGLTARAGVLDPWVASPALLSILGPRRTMPAVPQTGVLT